MENDQITDTEALKKELEDFISVAKKEKEKVEELAASIVTKSEEIRLFYEAFSDLRTKITDSQSGGQALLDQSTNLKEQISQISETAQRQSDQITEKANAIDVKIQEIESYHGAFTILRNKIDDGQTGLQALLDQSDILKKNTDDLKINSEVALGEIKEKAASVTVKVQEIEEYYSLTFMPLKEKVDDEKTGIQAVLNTVIDTKDEINKTKLNTEKRFEEVQLLATKSGELKRNAEASLNEIFALQQKSEEFKDSIGETLDLVTASSLTDSFLQRRDTIAKNVRLWKWATLLSVILLSAAVLYIYYLQNKAIDGFQNWHSWYRYLFTSPLIYLVYLCSHNYDMERNYEERYAFKTVLSTSLQAYIKLLSDKFADRKDELLKFALASIERIYKEPYEDKDEMQEVYGGFRNIFNFGVKNHVARLKDGKVTTGQTSNIEPKV